MTIYLMAVINSEDEGDIELLNYSEDPIKSSNSLYFGLVWLHCLTFVFSVQEKLISQN